MSEIIMTARSSKNSFGGYDLKFDNKYEKLCILVELKRGGQPVSVRDFHDIEVGALVREQSTQVNADPSTTCEDLTDPNSCQALETIDTLLNFLALLVMPIATIMIIIGGIQYSMAGDNSDSIKSAKAKIFKAVLALISFAALWSFLKWLIPGGLE